MQPRVRVAPPVTTDRIEILPSDPRTIDAVASVDGLTRRRFVAGLGALLAVTARPSRGLARAAISDGTHPPLATTSPFRSPISVWPTVVPRTAWDPENRLAATSPPEFSPSVERVFVHHTAVFPRYSPQESASLVYRICRQHMEERGFSDIAYNFLIDRYGVIFQGRAGGILKPVVGAHAVGFNQASVGVALIGDFETEEVPAAMAESLVRLTAWLCLWHEIDPMGRSTQRSTGGATTRYALGRDVQLPTIVGHRETGAGTPCPGHHVFSEIASGRLASRVAAMTGQASHVDATPRRGPLPPS